MEMETDTPPDSLAGIDVTGGLKRCLGKWSFYKKMLFMFSEQYHASAEMMLAYIEQGAFEDARTLAHSIKGSAGNLGAMQLNKDATALERAIKADAQDEIEQQFHAFSHSLKEVLSSLDGLRK